MAATKPWSERIPTAIADGEKLLGGAEYVLIPPHRGGNETEFTVALTAGEVALAKALHEASESLNAEFGGEIWPEALIAYCEKMERLDHD